MHGFEKCYASDEAIGGEYFAPPLCIDLVNPPKKTLCIDLVAPSFPIWCNGLLLLLVQFTLVQYTLVH